MERQELVAVLVVNELFAAHHLATPRLREHFGGEEAAHRVSELEEVLAEETVEAVREQLARERDGSSEGPHVLARARVAAAAQLR
jgi:hypothetical protein